MARRFSDDPFDDLFREIERLMESVMGAHADVDFGTAGAESHVGIHEYEDRIAVIADLPGVEKEDIDVACTDRTLSIRATGSVTRFAEQIPLPVPVEATSATATYNNGVLEVRLECADDSTSIDVE